MHPVHEHNRHAWDERVRLQKPYIDTAGEKDFLNALAIADPGGWLGGEVAGKRLLCLAAGGGRHGALFAAAGAKVTVVDLSPQMLELDRKAAATRGLRLNIVEASMDDLSVLGDASFDIVVQPVSTCYVPDVQAVYREVARVLAAGGIYLSQHKQPVSLQAEFVSLRQARGYWLSEPYYRQGALSPAAQDSLHREAGTIEFLHRWEQLLGGLCRAGFVIEDLGEPRHADPEALPNSFGHRSYFAPPYVVIKARRTTSAVREELKPKLWMP